MRRLLIVFLLLIAFAVMAAAIGIFFSGGTARIGGDQVLTWRIDTPLVDYSQSPDLSLFFPRRSSMGLAEIHRALTRARAERVGGAA